jgi:hypothetical protein
MRPAAYIAAAAPYNLEFPGFLHDVAPNSQGFGDAGKPRLLGRRKTIHFVTDFVECIDDVVDALDRLKGFHRRRH